MFPIQTETDAEGEVPSKQHHHSRCYQGDWVFPISACTTWEIFNYCIKTWVLRRSILDICEGIEVSGLAKTRALVVCLKAFKVWEDLAVVDWALWSLSHLQTIALVWNFNAKWLVLAGEDALGCPIEPFALILKHQTLTRLICIPMLDRTLLTCSVYVSSA